MVKPLKNKINSYCSRPKGKNLESGQRKCVVSLDFVQDLLLPIY